MVFHIFRLFAAALGLASPLVALSAAGAEDSVSFLGTIKPLLREKCVHCHNRRTLPDRISFETRDLAFTKTPAGQPVIVPGKPDESLLVISLERHIFHENTMPMVGPRPSDEEIASVRQWIKEGARWPRGPVGRIRPSFRL